MFRILSVTCLLTHKALRLIVNPWPACVRVTVLGLYVYMCVCVCFPYSGTSRNQAYKQQCQRLQRDTGMKYKRDFSLKCFITKLWRHLLTLTVPGDIQAPLSLLFQRRSILKLFKRLTVGYPLPGTPLDIRQKARVLWQSLSLLSQCSEHVTIPHNFRICVRALRACARVVSRVNGTDIRTSCLPHPLIVDCLLAPPTLCT